MSSVTLSESSIINNPFESAESILATTNTVSGLFVDLLNAGIEMFSSQTPNRFDTMIHSLHNSEFRLKASIPVTIELIDDDEAVATFSKGNIAISGDSPAQAMEELRYHLVGLYKIFKREKKNLGRVPKAQLKILEAYIGEARHK